jgi:hypothetical protein
MARLYWLQSGDCFYHTCDRKAGSDIFDKASCWINKRGDKQDIQDEGAGSEQG